MADESSVSSQTSPDDDGEDEKPNIPRMIALAVLLIGLSGYLYYVRVVNPPAVHKFYAELPGVDTRGLSDAQIQTLLQVTNSTQCGCGLNNCTMTVAECRNNDRGCHTSLAKANLMAANLRAGKSITDSLDKLVVPVMPAHMAQPPPGASGSPAVSSSPMTASGSPVLVPSGVPSDTTPSASSSLSGSPK